ncbi:transporter [Reyranella sp.]|uniref:transporter n=1 Tax=Reyranella sp. TaxID=1929291 RepID=UPI003BA9316B
MPSRRTLLGLKRTRNCAATIGFLIGVLPSTPASSQSDEDLARSLANPVAALISVPFQFNYDAQAGFEHGGHLAYMRFQPVVPVSISEEWNVVSRTILPVVSQWNTAPNSGNQFGLGDTVQSFFLSPKAPTSGGLIWGVGPVVVIPTGTHVLLSNGQWGAGPTGVALTQVGPWTIGVLANHAWSFATVRGSAPSFSATFVQPFVSFTTKEAWTYSLSSESTYDWFGDAWAVPLNFLISKVVKVDQQPVSFGIGARYWAATTNTSPQGFGVRAVVTILFPKR